MSKIIRFATSLIVELFDEMAFNAGSNYYKFFQALIGFYILSIAIHCFNRLMKGGN